MLILPVAEKIVEGGSFWLVILASNSAAVEIYAGKKKLRFLFLDSFKMIGLAQKEIINSVDGGISSFI